MLVYFFCQLMELMDSEEAVGQGEMAAPAGRGKKRGASTAAASGQSKDASKIDMHTLFVFLCLTEPHQAYRQAFIIK